MTEIMYLVFLYIFGILIIDDQGYHTNNLYEEVLLQKSLI